MSLPNGITRKEIDSVGIGEEVCRRFIGKNVLLTTKGAYETHHYFGILDDLWLDNHHTDRKGRLTGVEGESLPLGYHWHWSGSVPFHLSALF